LVAVLVMLRYHSPEPVGMRSITTNGHTYVGDPPALTLFERDPVAFSSMVVVVGAGLLVATLDLALRALRPSPRPGVAAVIAGGVVALFSLFGLLLGVASLGVIGALLVLSGLAAKRPSAPG
jgi:hypothetical protein